MVDELYSDDDEIVDALQEKSNESHNVKEFINTKEFFNSISINVNWSSADLLLMTLKYYLSNCLS